MSSGSASPSTGPTGASLLALYDDALPQVYGYLVRRCGRREVAEELTSEVFLAAVGSIERGTVTLVSVPWLIGIARHKLVDHWRAEERRQRRLTAVEGEVREADDPWDVELDALLADQTLASLAPQHRAALTLRYVDDHPVGQVAGILGRTVHATEALLVRARAAFRDAYEEAV